MSYPKQIASTLLTLSDNEEGEEGESPSPIVADPSVFAHDEEDGISFVQRLLIALGGPAGRGDGEPRSYATSSQGTDIYTYLFNTPRRNSASCQQPTTVNAFGASYPWQLTSNSFVPLF